MSSTIFISLIGKTVAKISRLKGGHGSALPGLVVEKIDPHFLRNILAELPHGVVVISGTNGKTTTTKMVVKLLRAAGLKVFTNDSGSNFTRGVTSSALREMRRGKLDADIAVLELDGTNYTMGITLLRYGNSWYVDTLLFSSRGVEDGLTKVVFRPTRRR